MAYQAFLEASAICRPPSPRPTKPRPRRSLPTPTPPPTRLAGPRKLFDCPRSPVIEEVRPQSARADILSSTAGAKKVPVVTKQTTKPLTHAQQVALESEVAAGWEKSVGFDASEENEKKKSRKKALHRQQTAVYFKRIAQASPKVTIGSELLYERGKDARILRSGNLSTRSAQSRIQAFDKRMQMFQMEAQEAMEKEKATLNDVMGGFFTPDKKPDLQLARDMHSTGEEVEVVVMTQVKDPIDELEEIPFKIVECSSQRGSFPATNLIDSPSCWQSQISKIRDQFVTIELEVMPIPIVAVQILPVTKESCPARCKVLCSNISAWGPWEEAWRFKVPDAHADHCQPYISRREESKDSKQEEQTLAPWWRLVIMDNHGSEACIAVAAPLKLFSTQQCDRTLLKSYRKTRVSYLDVQIYHAQQDPLLSPEERLLQRMVNTYGINMDFARSAHRAFLEADRQRFGVLSRADWERWMLQFLSVKDRLKVQPERLHFFWRQVDKDESNGVDFEEFLLFYNSVEEAANATGKSVVEFLFPGFGKPLKSNNQPVPEHVPLQEPQALSADDEQDWGVVPRELTEQDAIRRAAKALPGRKQEVQESRMHHKQKQQEVFLSHFRKKGGNMIHNRKDKESSDPAGKEELLFKMPVRIYG
mmetsp:Transcript_4380/g.7767  ORF Transcript_4380/g.7767 Transcript_4380/m.7767 type:complete len:647 (-) Transcript_4380:77-2017(-)